MSANRTVRVELGIRSYDIIIGTGLLNNAGKLIRPLLAGNRVAIITDEIVGKLYLSRLQSALDEVGITAVSLVLKSGEQTKSWDMIRHVVEWLIANKVEREDAVVALGGGVVGDLAGFAAAIVRRGVRLINIPTTLLAQVDSSVGGKTGINSPHGKNLVGAFHQPGLVLADIETLYSLDRRTILAGYGEIVKYGLLGDLRFFEWLEEFGKSLVDRVPSRLVRSIEWSCKIKADLVTRDETEFGDRALLNLGHTFGHALEAATGFSQRLLHGEAVAIGCGLAFALSGKLGLCPAEDRLRVREHFVAMGLTRTVCDIPGVLPKADTLVRLMKQDKKVRKGKNRLVLVNGIGRAFVAPDVDENAIREILEEATRRCEPQGAVSDVATHLNRTHRPIRRT